MLTDFEVRFLVIIFLAVAMPGIKHFLPHDTVYCFEALDHKYSVEYGEAVRASDVCVDVHAVSIAWAPISTLFKVAELRIELTSGHCKCS